MIKDLGTEVEKALSKELNGKVLEHIWVSNFGERFNCKKDFYTVKNGTVYLIGQNGELYPSEDTLITLKSECRIVGNYNPDKRYIGKQKSMTQAEIKKALKL